jgi:TPR repeat protein
MFGFSGAQGSPPKAPPPHAQQLDSGDTSDDATLALRLLNAVDGVASDAAALDELRARSARRGGCADADFALALLHATGVGGILARDDVEAAALLRRAALAGHGGAQLRYAALLGNSGDATQRARFLRRAAEAPAASRVRAAAALALGGAYASGSGVDADVSKAALWLHRAAADAAATGSDDAAAALLLLQRSMRFSSAPTRRARTLPAACPPRRSSSCARAIRARARWCAAPPAQTRTGQQRTPARSRCTMQMPMLTWHRRSRAPPQPRTTATAARGPASRDVTPRMSHGCHRSPAQNANSLLPHLVQLGLRQLVVGYLEDEAPQVHNGEASRARQLEKRLRLLQPPLPGHEERGALRGPAR